MTEYQIFLKNNKVKFYNRFSWFIIISNFSIILYVSYSLNKFREMKWSFLMLALLFLIIFILKYYLKKYFHDNAKWIPGFFFIIYAWAFLGFPWLMVLNIVLLFFSIITGKILVVHVKPTAIYYPTFPKKSILWSELSNVILKDGYLTIDFKNNKLIQQLIDENNTKINEKEFNDFCKQQLNK